MSDIVIPKLNLSDFQESKINDRYKINSICKLHSQNDNKDYTGIIFAVKIQKKVEEKIDSISKFHYPSIIKVIGYSKKKINEHNRLIVITEFSPVILLSDLFKDCTGSKYDKFPYPKRYIVALGVAYGLYFLNSKKKTAHENLRPSEIWLDNNFFPYISLLDFNDDLKPETDRGDAYVAPELNNDEPKYSESSNVFAYSKIFYQLLTNKDPNNLESDAFVNMKEQFQDFFQSSLDDNPENRPNFENIIDFLSSEKTKEEFQIKNNNEIEDYVNFLKVSAEHNDKKDPKTKEVNPDVKDKEILPEKNTIIKAKGSETESDSKKTADIGNKKDESDSTEHGGHGTKKDSKTKPPESPKGEDPPKEKRRKSETDSDSTEHGGHGAKKDSKTKIPESPKGEDPLKEKRRKSETDSDSTEHGGHGTKKDIKAKPPESPKGEDPLKEKRRKSETDSDSTEHGGHGTKKDSKTKTPESPDESNVESLIEYADLQYDGIDGKVNYKEAAKYYKKAADEKDSPEAMCKYGDMLRYGLGVDFNKEEALEYYKKAMKKNYPPAKKRYDALSKRPDFIKDPKTHS